MNRNLLRLLVRAWLLIALSDFTYASFMSTVVYGGTFAKLWQGVASVLLGPGAMQGGARTVLVGIAMHLSVALLWTTVFLAIALASPALRRFIATPGGIVATAVAYGPIVWLVMSLVVIPTLSGRPPTINYRWWIAIAGHIVAVALPIVATIGRGLAREPVVDGAMVSVA